MAASDSKKEPISTSLDANTIILLDTIAEADMTSLSSVVEKAIWEYIGRRFVAQPGFRRLVSNHASRVSDEQ